MTIADKISRAKDDYDAVHNAGKKAEYDAFWGNFQDNGNRGNYSYAFNHWTDENFKPKYNINPTDLQYAFRYSTITDLKGILEKQGVKLDVSNASNLASAFFYADSTTTCPVIDVSKGLIKTFNIFTHAHAMKSIEKVILPTGKALAFDNSFHTCTALEDIVIEGDIMANGLNFQWSPKLSRDSITSVINALSGDTTGLTVTFSRAAVENAFENNRTTISFGFTAETDGADVTLADNGDGTVTMNGSIASDSYFHYGEPTDTFPAGSYAISFPQNNYGTVYVTFYDLEGNPIWQHSGWDTADGVSTFTVDKDFVMKARLYLMGAETFNDAVVAYPTIRPDFEALKATKPNWTIALV